MALAGAQNLLYVLTGQTPQITMGSYDKLRKGEHLRFTFAQQDASFHLVKTLLKILNIQHCSELYKHLEPRQGPAQLAFYITVGPAACPELMSYVAPGAVIKCKANELKLELNKRFPHVQAALLKILFDPSFCEQITIRNNDKKFNLDGIMMYFAQLIFNTAPCFSYLQKQGIKPSFTVDLEIDQEAQEEAEAGPAITPARQLAGEKRTAEELDSEKPAKTLRLVSK